ncbi:MAG: hypothetical protein AAGG50_00835 [Bacteroidota bacterium]
MRTVLALTLSLLCAAAAVAQPRATFRPAALSGGAEAHFVGTAWSYDAGSASTVARFAVTPADHVYASGEVRDEVALRRPVLPGSLPASVRSASHLVFDARGEGTVFVALEVSDHAEPFVYPVTLHPGADMFRIPLDRFRHRSSRAPFRGDTVTRVAFYVTTPNGTAAPAPFELTVGTLAFEYKRPLGARY